MFSFSRKMLQARQCARAMIRPNHRISTASGLSSMHMVSHGTSRLQRLYPESRLPRLLAASGARVAFSTVAPSRAAPAQTQAQSSIASAQNASSADVSVTPLSASEPAPEVSSPEATVDAVLASLDALEPPMRSNVLLRARVLSLASARALSLASTPEQLLLLKVLAAEDLRAHSLARDALRKAKDALARVNIVEEEDVNRVMEERTKRDGRDGRATGEETKPVLSEAPLNVQHFVNDLKDIIASVNDCHYHKRILAIMNGLKGPCDVNVHNHLIRSHAIRGNADVALACVKVMMEEHDVHPSIETFALMILAYGNSKNLGEAQKWFDVYRNSNESTGDAPYCSLIAACVMAGDIPAALNVMSHVMAEDSIPLTAVHMTAFLQALLDKREYQQVLDWYTRLSADSSGQLPNVTDKIQEIVFDAAVSLRNEEVANELFPSDYITRTPSSLALSEYGVWKLLEQKDDKVGLATFAAMRNNKRLEAPPLPKFLGTVLRISAAPSSSPANADSTLGVGPFDSRVDRNIQVLHYAHESGLRSYVISRFIGTMLQEEREAKRVANALKIVRVVQTHFPNPVNLEICEPVIEFFLKQGSALQASEVSVKDFESLFKLARKGNQVLALLADMEARGLQVTVDICNTVVQDLKKFGNKDVLSEWIKAMRRLGVLTGPRLEGEVMTFEELQQINSEILSLLKKGEVNAAVALSESVLSAKWVPAINSMAGVIDALFRTSGRAPEALAFADKMIRASKSKTDAKFREFVVRDHVFRGWISLGEISEAFNEALLILQVPNQLPNTSSLKILSGQIVTQLTTSESAISGPDTARFVTFVDKCLAALKTANSERYGGLMSDFIFILCRTGKHESALELYNHLQSKALHARPFVHKELVRSVALSGDRVKAMEILDDAMELVREGRDHLRHRKGDEKFSIQASFYQNFESSWFDPILSLSIQEKNWINAMSVWSLVKQRNYRMNSSTVRLMLESLIEAGDLVQAVNFLDEMRKIGVSPPNEFLAAILSKDKEVLLSTNIQFLSQALETMGMKNGKFEMISRDRLEAFIDLQLERGAPLHSILRLKDGLLKTYNSPSSTAMGNSLIQVFGHYARLIDARDVFLSMPPSSEALPNSRNIDTYSLLMFNAAKNGEEAILEEALHLLEAEPFGREDVEDIKAGISKIKLKLGEI